MDSAKGIIEDIRKNEYGIGLETDPAAQNVLAKSLARTNRALERLSDELYAKDTHFVLELIQNADDNKYPLAIKKPILKFEIDDRKILVQNNEAGFSEDNVRALCDVGKTTKSKLHGYIGEKGIGFKSVFLVTNEPHIYSNGFRFKFKRNDEKDELGFIIPHWLDGTPNYVDQSQTNIVLPLREDIKEEILKFRDLEPTLILFLNKLKVIEVFNRIEGSVSKITREDRNGRVEIEHAKGHENWLLLKNNIKDPPKEEKREGITESELILAYPLKPDGAANTSNEQKIFAYLPTRGYGFKFIIQADFLVPSSREDIHKNKTWNKWIRNNIPSAFMSSLKKFKTNPILSKTYYNFIPLVGDISDDFFEPTAKQIIKKLKNAECLLTESGAWAKPSKIFYADKNFRNIISNDDCKKAFGQEYLNSGAVVKREILKALKVKDFSLKHLLVYLNNKELVSVKNDKWFAKLYAFLNDQELSEKQIEHIRELKIFKLENGLLTSLAEGPIFFPLTRKQEYGFENDIRIIKKIEYKDDEKVKKASDDFLQKIGIRRASYKEIIEDHILPVFESGEWKDKADKKLNGYVRYIKDNIFTYEKENTRISEARKGVFPAANPLRRIKKGLMLRVKDRKTNESQYARPEDIYLTSKYGIELDFEKLFQGIEGVLFIHDDYISQYQHQLSKKAKKKKQKKIEKRIIPKIESWKYFFLKIGVNESLIVKKDPESLEYMGAGYADNKVTKKRIYSWEKSKTIWKNISWNNTDFSYYIKDDYLCKDFEKLMEKIKPLDESEKRRICKILINNFSKNWTKYQNKLTCKYYYRYSGMRGWTYEDTLSTFTITLKKTKWIPSEKGQTLKPAEVFNSTQEIKSLLGDTVDYIDAGNLDENFIKDIGINHEASVDQVLGYLKDKIKNGEKAKENFIKIYEFINGNFEGKEELIRKSFQDSTLIYIPDTQKAYFNAKQVLWEDVSDIFGTNKGYLEKHYPNLKIFFVEKLKINEKTKPKDYANALVDISEKEKISKKDELIIRKIYKELDTHLNPEINVNLISDEDWWDDFIDKNILYTEKDEFWTNEEDVFIADHDGLYDLFKDEAGVAFLKIPKNYHPKIRYFLEAAKIRLISEAIKVEPEIDEKPLARADLTKSIRMMVPYILRYLYQKEHSRYQELKKSEKISQINSIKCYSLKSIEVTYTLHGKSVTAKTPAILHEGNLYIQEESTDTDYLSIELAKLFGSPKGLDDFIGLLLSKRTDEKIESFLKAKGIQELPEDEKEIHKIEEPETEIEDDDETGELGEDETEPAEPRERPAQEKERTEGYSETGESELVEWEQECEPEEAVTNVEQYNGEAEQTATRSPTTRTVIPDQQTKTEKDHDEKKDVLSPESKKAIGSWGEEYALRCIKKEFAKKYKEGQINDTENGFVVVKNGEQIAKVKWLNKEYDQGIGYDIEIIENGIKFYVEVKSTKTDEKEWFDVSRKQWEMIGEHGDKYIIYRVYNAGKKKDAKSKRIDDPAGLWLEGTLKAYPIRIRI